MEESGFHAHLNRLIALSLAETENRPSVCVGMSNSVDVLSYWEKEI